MSRRPDRTGQITAQVALATNAAESLPTIAGDPKHLGARIGFTSVLHTWGSAPRTIVAVRIDTS